MRSPFSVPRLQRLQAYKQVGGIGPAFGKALNANHATGNGERGTGNGERIKKGPDRFHDEAIRACLLNPFTRERIFTSCPSEPLPVSQRASGRLEKLLFPWPWLLSATAGTEIP